MKIAIAGANSFIGKRLLNKLSDDNVIAVVRENCSFSYGRATIVHCDMEEYHKLGSLCGEGDIFIDLSWAGSRGIDRQNKEMQMKNYIYSMEAMKSMADVGYKTLVSAGSQAEYGLCDEIITEDTALNPNTEYGIYKVKTYQDTRELATRNGIRFIEPRYFSLYGPGDYDKTLIMATLKKLISGDKVELNECTQQWDYLFVDDAMDGLLGLCKTDEPGGVYNFATGNYHSLREYILDMKDAVGSSSEVEFGAIKYNGLYIDLRPNVSKLRATGWIPNTSFKDGIRKTAKEL